MPTNIKPNCPNAGEPVNPKPPASSCCHCGSSVGDSVLVQPTVCDGDTWCPRCFVWHRMNQRSESGTETTTASAPRFNASQACAAKCTACGWLVLSFGMQPGQRLARCSHCGQNRAILVPVPKDGLTRREKADLTEIVQGTKKAS
jgi:hypothetical protein